MIQEVLGLTEGTYTYNLENRAATINSQTNLFFSNNFVAGKVDYTYDVFGRRNSRATESFYKKHKHDDDDEDRDYKKHGYHHDDDKDHWKHQTDVNYLYDGLSFNYLAEIGKQKPGNGHKKDLYFTELVYGKGKLLSQEDIRFDKYRKRVYANNERYFTHDIQGSVIAVTSKNGKIIDKVHYDAFGNIMDYYSHGHDDDDDEWKGHSFQSNGTMFGYNGKLFDSQVNLYNYGFRDYAPQLGRFTTIDPIRDGDNWYVYCSNDPV
ncbi:MAG: RHS repeat-associated core domain-containing protein, partial [Proteobacteria bacterium]|nr:RHS repeat-associated core domain-containing protein [Pseudomonadota bacterium]